MAAIVACPVLPIVGVLLGEGPRTAFVRPEERTAMAYASPIVTSRKRMSLRRTPSLSASVPPARSSTARTRRLKSPRRPSKVPRACVAAT